MKNFFSLFLSAAALICCTVASASPIGATGPDAFGHVGSDIAYNLRDIRTTGSTNGLNLGDDQVSNAINLGFSFGFYGNVYTQTYVSTNGFLSFDSAVSQGCCSASPVMSNDSVQNAIEGNWNDLYPPGGGSVLYQTSGAVGSREFVLGFYVVPQCCSNPPDVTFEIILHEGSNNIEFQYGSVGTDGSQFGIGIENSDDTDGLQVLLSSNTQLQLSRQGYLITDGQNTVPEPGSLLLLSSALLGLGAIKRRKTQSVSQA